MANTEESADGQADASAENTQNPGTQIDAVSGATISSTAVVTGINEAYEFLQSAK
ncbi:MAG: FMN-binding protein [Lachnospiraceae bacterium]